MSALHRLGIFNFYRRFSRSAASLHLTILKGHSKKNDQTQIYWNTELEKLFEAARSSFIDYSLLHFLMGGVLEQITKEGERQPLGFFSTKFTPERLKWCTYD